MTDNAGQTLHDNENQPAIKISWRRKVVYSLLPLLLLLGLIEGWCRIFPYHDQNRTPGGLVMPDPDLIWRLRPRPGKTNEYGMKDTPINEKADIKILLLGDSVSWGDGIDEIHLLYPSLLEQSLNKLSNNKTYEVINAAVLGYSTFQEARYLKLYGLKFHPDLIILQFCLNDVYERYLNVSEYGGDNMFLGIDTRKGSPGIYGFFLRHSRAFEHLLRFLQWRARREEEYDVKKMTRDQLSPELEQAWRTTLSDVDDIYQTAAQNHISFLLVITPYNFQLDDPNNLRQPQDRLIEFARSRGIAYVDLLPILAKSGVTDQLYCDPSHLSLIGHKAVAYVLVQPVFDVLKSGSVSNTAK